MPQIDSITFFSQVLNSTLFIISFYLLLTFFLLPQYVLTFFSLKILWTFLNTYLIKLKFFSNLIFAHRVLLDTKINLKFLLLLKISCLTSFKALIELKKNIHKPFLFRYISLKLYALANVFFIDKKNILFNSSLIIKNKPLFLKNNIKNFYKKIF